ncbi:MAG TPA: permease-like cell division protein FtsX [Gemmatimonadaceae bacterium]|nr:permease-like cell division protein FtsX [Gemmatimonadaceae bacterium]
MRLTVREALLAFRRAPLLSTLSVMTIAFSLFAFGLFGLVAVNIARALAQVEERVELRAYVVDGTDLETLTAAMGDIEAFPEVATVQRITPEQALERARRELGEFRDVFDASFLPTSLEVRLRPGFRDPATVKAVADRIASYPFVDDVRFGEEWVTNLHNVQTVAGAAGVALGVLFAVVAIIIIGATIRMSVLAREREISIMRLVGATDGFIRRPFLLDGVAKGILGGLVALLLTWIANEVITHYLIRTTFFSPSVAVAGVAFGAVIGVLGSALSVGRHLRRV